MNLHDTTPRVVTKSPLVCLATLLYGSAWFAVSVMALCYVIVTKRKQPPARVIQNTIVIVTPNSLVTPDGAQPQSMLVPRDTNYRVTFGDLPKGLQRRGRRDPPTTISIMPPDSGSITITTCPNSPTLSLSAAAPSISAPAVLGQEDAQELPAGGDPAQEQEQEEQSEEALAVTEETSTSPFCPISRRPTLSMKLPKVFRRKSLRTSEGSCDDSSRASTPRSLSPAASPQQRLAELLPEEDGGRESIPLSQRKSYHRPKDDAEFIQTRFVNPLKFKPRRARTSSGSTAPEQPPISRSSSPPSAFTNHKRNRSFASMVGMAIRPHHRRTQSSSPHRGSFSSFSTATSSNSSSSAATSATCASKRASKRSSSVNASERDVPRTQPYGAPYYAPMPVPRTTRARRTSATHSGVVVKRRASEDRDGEEPHARLVEVSTIPLEESDIDGRSAGRSSAVDDGVPEDGNTLGLSLGGAPRRRHRSLQNGASEMR